MAKAKIEVCPKCGGAVFITPSWGGLRSGDLTHYLSKCKKCGNEVDDLGGIKTGSMREAVAAWNDYAKAKRLSGDQDRQ